MTMTPEDEDATAYGEIGAELAGGLTFNDLRRDGAEAARRHAARTGAPWPPVPPADPYACTLMLF